MRSREGLLKRWERGSRIPLLVLALLFAAAYAAPILDHHRNGTLVRAAGYTEWAVWAAFAVDYLVRLALVRDRWRFVRRHPVQLLTVALPLLQPLRLLRVVSALLLVGQRVRIADQIRLTTYVVGSVFGLLVFGALGVLEAERDAPDSNIHSLEDALWWAFTTMTTVGYGDHAPTTGRGRLLAVGLMLSGIALLGVVTANIAAWFVARFHEEEAESRRDREAMEEMAAELRALREQVARLRDALPDPPAAVVEFPGGRGAPPGPGGGGPSVPGPAAER